MGGGRGGGGVDSSTTQRASGVPVQPLAGVTLAEGKGLLWGGAQRSVVHSRACAIAQVSFKSKYFLTSRCPRDAEKGTYSTHR